MISRFWTRPLMAALLGLALVFSIITALPSVGMAQSKTFTRKQPTTAAMKIVDNDPARGGIIIQNVGSVNVYLSNVSTVSSTAGILLATNRFLTFVGDTDAWYAIAASGTADLRIIALTTAQAARGNIFMTLAQLNTGGITNGAASGYLAQSDGANLVASPISIVSSAITANTTTTSEASGVIGITTNATGLGTVFRSDGSKWQLLANYADESAGTSLGTVATTGNTDEYILAPFAGTVTGVDFSGVDALTANDTNYITFSITNLGQAGSGSNPILAATAANTTQATGGTGLSANTKRSLTLNGTGSNLIVAKGDRLRIRAAATGTLANTVTFSRVRIYFTRLS